MRSMKKSQRGFTLIEITIAVVLIGLLIALVVPALSGGAEDTSVGGTAIQLTSTVPQALGRHYARTRTCSGITTANLVDRGVAADTAWGDNWSVSASTATTATLTWPLTSSSDPASAGADLASQLNNSNMVSSATFSSPNLVVVYPCR